MSDPSEPVQPPARTPEMHAAVRRRALPLAFCALICGIGGILLLQSRSIAIDVPPNVLAVNLSFCALLMGAGLLFYAKGTPGTGPAQALAVAGILAGLVGPAMYAMQAVNWRVAMESRERQNVIDIALAAQKFATENGGNYPPDLMVLLERHYIDPRTLLSPYGATAPLKDDVAALRARFKDSEVLTTIDVHSDYTYVGADLRLSPAATASAPATQPSTLPREIIVAYAKSPVMRTNLAIAFVDGSARFITLEQAEGVLKSCNDARASLGLPPLQRPASIERALREKP